jgi:hypothetical protein
VEALTKFFYTTAKTVLEIAHRLRFKYSLYFTIGQIALHVVKVILKMPVISPAFSFQLLQSKATGEVKCQRVLKTAEPNIPHPRREEGVKRVPVANVSHLTSHKDEAGKRPAFHSGDARPPLGSVRGHHQTGGAQRQFQTTGDSRGHPQISGMKKQGPVTQTYQARGAAVNAPGSQPDGVRKPTEGQHAGGVKKQTGVPTSNGAKVDFSVSRPAAGQVAQPAGSARDPKAQPKLAMAMTNKDGSKYVFLS